MAKVWVINLDRCNGCYNCQLACKDEHVENDWTPYAKPQPRTGHFWMKIVEMERGSIPKVKVTYLPLLCQHCDNPPCIPACPTKAIYKRADGLVLIDPNKCNGCKACLDACPYGVIYFNNELGIAQKCTG
ncbi:MAG: 4Fe-4S dicluster domain-containing protein, partial [Nitrososphaerota archaeon]